MKLFRKIDTQGYFIEDVLLKEAPLLQREVIVEDIVEDNSYIEFYLDPLYVSTPCPNGLIKPRYIEGQWQEGETNAEEIKNEITRLERMEEIRLRLVDLDIKTFKFIDGDITEIEYEPFKKEKIALRLEYKDLENV
jgi:hypothetical protein